MFSAIDQIHKFGLLQGDGDLKLGYEPYKRILCSQTVIRYGLPHLTDRSNNNWPPAARTDPRYCFFLSQEPGQGAKEPKATPA